MMEVVVDKNSTIHENKKPEGKNLKSCHIASYFSLDVNFCLQIRIFFFKCFNKLDCFE